MHNNICFKKFFLAFFMVYLVIKPFYICKVKFTTKNTKSLRKNKKQNIYIYTATLRCHAYRILAVSCFVFDKNMSLCRRHKASKMAISNLVISLSDFYSHSTLILSLLQELGVWSFLNPTSLPFPFSFPEMFLPSCPSTPLSSSTVFVCEQLFSRPLLVSWLQIITAIWLQYSQPGLSAGSYRQRTCQADALNRLCG